MESNSVEIDLVQLQNIIDAEFEKANKGSKCNLLTTSFVDRVEDVQAKQQELKDFLHSLDVQIKKVEEKQLKNKRECNGVGSLSSLDEMVQRFSAIEKEKQKPSEKARDDEQCTPKVIVSGGKDAPIVIDDEEDSSQPALVAETNVLSAEDTHAEGDRAEDTHVERDSAEKPSEEENAVTPVNAETLVNVPKETEGTPTEEEATESNVRRRPLILEQAPQVSQDEGDLEMLNAPPKDTLCLNLTPVEPSPSRLSPPAPVVSADSDVSTETASSPMMEHGQPSMSEDLQSSENDSKKDVIAHNPGNSQQLLKELDEKIEIHDDIISGGSKSSPRPHSPSDFKIGSRVLGKRSSDMWFSGEIIKTMTDKNGQAKYTIKYDKGPKGVLSLNHICPEEPAAMCDLSVGSRVVGLYGTLNIWYAGIIAEMACPGNRKRLLVFFDDGFAQYLAVKKLHKVHHKGQNVWEDVIEDSRDFIQEYLEDYPSRPMLHVRVGQWIRTEWKGQWLKARVMNVDGSLVKMLFQVDNRSEWIYRGSTRLDPLYNALVTGETTTSTKARSRKLTRKTSSKDNAPYIEYNITKPCYGVSPYSKTDPEGIQQSQLEEQRQRTQQQQQHEGIKHAKKEQREEKLTKEEKRLADLHEESSKTPDTKPSLASVRKTKPLSTEIQIMKEITIPDDEVVVESTYSCIQASSARKKTGASLVNNVIFDLKEEHAYAAPQEFQSPSSCVAQPSPKPVVIQEKKPEPPSDQWKAPWLKNQRNKQRTADNVIKSVSTSLSQKQDDAASILKHKLEAKSLSAEKVKVPTEVSTAKRQSSSISHSVPHTCSFACSRSSSKVSIDPLRHNPLAVPILMDWKREIVKRRGKTNKRDVYYRTPCYRRLRNMAEVIRYLQLTGESSLNVDHFTFDWRVNIDNALPPIAVVDDISNGQENRPLPAINKLDATRPPNIQYMSMRQFAPEVQLATDPGFLTCCDCKDNCSDLSKCACIQLTLHGCKAMDMEDISKMTYQYRKLKDCIQTGIYECNSECSCTKNCLNRVVQNGIQLRLEVFKTENRGWGLRATDDIPAGSFVCTYAGYILNEELANQDGRKYGDEYMAELDYIEVAEKAKEGYESDVSDLEEDDNVIDEMMQSDDNMSDSGNSGTGSRHEDDDDYEDEEEDENAASSDSGSSSDDGINKELEMEKRRKRRVLSEEALVVERESKANVLSRLGTPLMCILALKRNNNDLKKSSEFLSQFTDVAQTTFESSTGVHCKAAEESRQSLTKNKSDAKPEVPTHSVPSSVEKQAIESSVTDKENKAINLPKVPEQLSKCSPVKNEGTTSTKDEVEAKAEAITSKEEVTDPEDTVPELLSANDLQRLAASQPKSLQPPVLTRRGTVLDETIEKLKKRVVNPDSTLLEFDEFAASRQSDVGNESDQKSKDVGGKHDDIEQSETSSSQKSTTTSQSTSSRSSSPAVDNADTFKQSTKINQSGESSVQSEKADTQGSSTRYPKTRTLFGEEHCYVIDATFGNCGRFLNHSCSPNLFVQNVFVDTHDMRFPWVAFFAQSNIKAGSELTWDYMYEVGSVRDKSLYCLCGSSGCRGRLL